MRAFSSHSDHKYDSKEQLVREFTRTGHALICQFFFTRKLNVSDSSSQQAVIDFIIKYGVNLVSIPRYYLNLDPKNPNSVKPESIAYWFTDSSYYREKLNNKFVTIPLHTFKENGEFVQQVCKKIPYSAP